jgi:hypothetical protein
MDKTIFFWVPTLHPRAVLATWLNLGGPKNYLKMNLIQQNEIIHNFCIPTLINARRIFLDL